MFRSRWQKGKDDARVVSKTDSQSVHLPFVRNHDIGSVSSRLAVHVANVTAQEPRVFPCVFAMGAGAVPAIALAFLDDEDAGQGPHVRVMFSVARHVC